MTLSFSLVAIPFTPIKTDSILVLVSNLSMHKKSVSILYVKFTSHFPYFPILFRKNYYTNQRKLAEQIF